MRTTRSIILLLVFAVLGLTLGSLLRKAGHLSHGAIHRSVSETPLSRGRPAETRLEPTFLQHLERNLAKATGVTRWLLWVEAVEKASLEELPGMVDLAKGDAGALKLIALRWIDHDPKNLLLFLSGNNDRGSIEILSEILFPEWAKRDPEALIKALDAAPAVDGPLRPWRVEAAEQVTRYHPELGLPLFDRWSIGMFTPSMRGVSKWAAENPREAAEFAIKIRAHYPAAEAIKTIGEEWAKKDPAAAMAFVGTLQNSRGQLLAQSTLKAWAQKDLASALEWLVKAKETERNRLSAPIVEEWAKNEPAAALLWCEQNLKGTRLSESAAAVLRGAAETDVWAAARLVQAMEPSPAKSAGAVAVTKKLRPGREDSSGAARMDLFSWAGSLDPDSTRKVLEEAVRYWPDEDPKPIASFLLTTPVENIPSSVYLLVGRALARDDPAGALDWANQLPGEARLSGGSDAFARWTQSQPSNAMEWLSKIPENDVRRTAYLKTALEYLAYENNATERVAALPKLDRSAALELAKTLDLPPDRRERLLAALTE